MKTAAIIVAAGRGTRAGGSLPKQYQCLDDRPVLDLTVAALARHSAVVQLVVVLHRDDRGRFAEMIDPPTGVEVTAVEGGATRDASVRAGLAAVAAGCEAVMIHDAARPLVSDALLDRVLAGLAHSAGAAPALAVTDALWQGEGGRVVGARERAGLYRAQTPQGFRLTEIRAAHAAWADRPGAPPAADDVEVARAHGLDVWIVEGDEDNIKITLPGDFARAAAILRRRAADGG